MDYLRLFGGIPASDCDERTRIEESLARTEAEASVDQEHSGDEAPSRSIEGEDAAADRKAKDAEDGCYAEDAIGRCYDLCDEDALKDKASVIVSNVISRAMSVVEREKSEDTLRTDTTLHRSEVALTVSKWAYLRDLLGSTATPEINCRNFLLFFLMNNDIFGLLFLYKMQHII